MRRFMAFFAISMFPVVSNAGLVNQSSYYDYGYKEFYTYKGSMMNNTLELRYAFKDDAETVNDVAFEVFSGDFDLAMYLFTISEEAFWNGPNGGQYDPENTEFTPGGSEYLGSLMAYDADSGFRNWGGFNDPKLETSVATQYLSLFIVPEGTTEQMIRKNDVAGMQDLLMAQASGSSGLDYSFDLGFSIFGGDAFVNHLPYTSTGYMYASSDSYVDVSESGVAGMFGLGLLSFVLRKKIRAEV